MSGGTSLVGCTTQRKKEKYEAKKNIGVSQPSLLATNCFKKF